MIKSKTLFIPLLIVLILVPLIALLLYNQSLKPVSTSAEQVPFRITPGQPVTQIAANLKEENLVRNAFTFRLLVAQMGITKSIQAGDFIFTRNMSAKEIAQSLTHGAIDLWITIPEGLREEEIAELIESKLKDPDSTSTYQFDKEQFTEFADEGYMFPDTYLIAKDANSREVADRLRRTFDEKVGEDLLEKGAENNLTLEEVVTLASLIEREAKTNEERATISGILINRLNAGIALQVDATVQYAKGYDSANGKWWPQITVDDYQSVRSVYNTYRNPGLPPAPISNPGIESIRAAANPQETDYLYYLHDADGKIHYAETVDQHNQNIQNYL
ncbi:MAG: endolytic transglycosylase MltG [Candidatus Curtissbacteria bacterium]|nr:endolytic transglycosylase MltG [Candidatus Curtissbacteria bacterium]